MRCIEILYHNFYYHYLFKINYNMRCIEILLGFFENYAIVLINYNMRCIEIILYTHNPCVKFDKLQHEMY